MGYIHGVLPCTDLGLVIVLNDTRRVLLECFGKMGLVLLTGRHVRIIRGGPPGSQDNEPKQYLETAQDAVFAFDQILWYQRPIVFLFFSLLTVQIVIVVIVTAIPTTETAVTTEIVILQKTAIVVVVVVIVVVIVTAAIVAAVVVVVLKTFPWLCTGGCCGSLQ